MSAEKSPAALPQVAGTLTGGAVHAVRSLQLAWLAFATGAQMIPLGDNHRLLRDLGERTAAGRLGGDA